MKVSRRWRQRGPFVLSIILLPGPFFLALK
jgi:hypothetical protein